MDKDSFRWMLFFLQTESKKSYGSATAEGSNMKNDKNS